MPGSEHLDVDYSSASFASGGPMMASRSTMMRSTQGSRYKESVDFQLKNGGIEDEPPGCSYMAESASLASSDLVDISPIDSNDMVESASIMSLPNVKKEEDSEEEQSSSLDENGQKQTKAECTGAVLDGDAKRGEGGVAGDRQHDRPHIQDQLPAEGAASQSQRKHD